MNAHPHAYRQSLALVILAAVAATRAVHAAEVPSRPSPGCLATALSATRGVTRTIAVDGVQRAYILDVPDTITPQKPVPLLFDFHGFGHSAAGLWKVSGFRDLAARDRFITVYPDGLPVHLLGTEAAGWEIFTAQPNRDVAFVTRLLDELEHTYCIDRARVFATGFSNGAFFSHLLGCTLADRFAAIAPVSGGRITVPCNPPRAVPVIIFHGRQDPRISVDQARQARTEWSEKNGCRTQTNDGCAQARDCRDGAEVVYCEGDFAHSWPPDATARIWDFLRQHPLAAP